ncbi:MAG: type II secretion system protein [Terriglobia bacterium]
MGQTTRQKGFSVIEMMIGVSLLLTLTALALPNFHRARIAANESSVVANMRTLNSALATYNISHRHCGYPDSLTRLGPGNPPTDAAADLLDSVVANDAFAKSGYHFTYTLVSGAGDCAGVPGTDYEIEAQPAARNGTGGRGFYTDSSRIIRGDPDGDADASSPPV